ncbi:MAG: (2Fe-2S)-binding protein [Spirochaetales bacterium]|nr:(2Fe-2S)-binding protein [Spirochaetales bacterium]
MKEIKFVLNGKEVSVEADPLKRLLDVLREDNRMTGVKEGCGEGECGACSVLMNGVLVNSCMIPLGAAEDSEIVTPEGIRETEKGKLIIDAFGDAGAVQCGFCTPGMMMATEALLTINKNPDEPEIREALSGNLCRCTGYDLIVKGVQIASERGKDLW